MKFQKPPTSDSARIPGTFHIPNVDTHNLEAKVRAILWQYVESAQALPVPYFFAFEFTTLYAKTGWVAAQMVVNLVQEAVEDEYMPYTIDWYAVERRFYQQDVLLTFAMRPCDLRELVADD